MYHKHTLYPIVRWFYTIVLCFGAWIAGAQSPVYHYIAPQYEPRSIKLNTKGGNEYLTDALEDDEGYIWFSSAKGIYAFDGDKAVHYSAQNADYALGNESSMESFGTISKGASGLLYFQERNYYSFICFDPVSRKLKFRFRSRYEQNKGLFFMMSISDGNHIAGAFFDRKAGRYHIRPIVNDKNAKELCSGPYDPDEMTCFQFGDGYHWLSQNRQILRIDPDVKHMKAYQLPDSAIIIYTYTDKDHVYFLNQQCNRIYTWDAANDRIVPYMSLPSLPLIQYSKFTFTGQLQLKFAIKEERLYIANNLCFYVVDKENKTIQDLSALNNHDNQVTKLPQVGSELRKILFTGKNDIYLVRENGVQVLSPKPQKESHFLVPLADGPYRELPVMSFRALAEDPQGNIYASYYNGLLVKKKGTNMFSDLPLPQSLLSKAFSTYSLHYWNGQLLWNNLVTDLSGSHYKFIGERKIVEHTAQYLDRDTLWFYIWKTGILYAYDLKHKKLSSHVIDKNLGNFGEPIEEISDMTPDETGRNLWLATKWNGIALITKEGRFLKKFGWRQLKIKSGVGVSVNALELNKDGLWFGCADGLGLLNTTTGAHMIYHNPFNEGGRINDRNVYSIVKDSCGNFYLGTSKGIVYFDVPKKRFYNLPTDHPLANLEFNRASALRSSDNQYYFGTTDGLYAFRPSELSFDSVYVSPLHPIKVSNITIFNGQQKKYRYLGVWGPSGRTLVLSPNDNTITINFALPELDRSVYYSYRIKEQNEQWSDYSLDNKITLFSLRPGNYTLEIKASSDLNDDTARFFVIKIIVNQVWHKLPWVRLLFLIATISIVSVIMRIRYWQKLRRAEELARLRTKISMDLHDDVGSILSGLAVQGELLSYTAAAEQKSQLNSISKMSREAMDTMRDIVWSMDNRKDKYENMIDRMRAFAEKHLQAVHISHKFIIEGIAGEQFIGPEKRQAIYLIFKEALTNIIRHADASQVLIKLFRQKNMLYLSIQDDGRNKDSGDHSGMGMDNMKHRAEKIGGTFEAKYQNGFLVLLKVPC